MTAQNISASDFIVFSKGSGIEMPTYMLGNLKFSGDVEFSIQQIKTAERWMSSSREFRNYWRAKKKYFGSKSKIIDLARLGGSQAICSSETFSLGGGECSVEYYDNQGSLLFEIVGENGTRGEALDFNKEYRRIVGTADRIKSLYRL